MKVRSVLFCFAVLLSLDITTAHADKAWEQSLGLNPSQKMQLKAADQTRNGVVKPAQSDRDSATQTLISQVLANAGDTTLQPILSQVLGDIKTIDGAEENFWQSISGSLTATQVAKIYLKRHPPKAPANNPPSAPPAPGPKPAGFNWGQYFGLGKDIQTQLKTADQARNSQMKTTREEQESAVAQLYQLVQSNAPDASLQPTLTTLFNDLHTEHVTEQAFWGTTLPSFLTPTQMAKIYLHRHTPKGSFNPPLTTGK